MSSWWEAFGGDVRALLVHEGGRLQGAGVVAPALGPIREAAVNDYSESWDVIAADERRRRRLWAHIAANAAPKLVIPGLPAAGTSVGDAQQALEREGYRVATGRHQLSPYVGLPDTWDELLGAVSRKLRSNVRRMQRLLAEEGTVNFRTNAGPELDVDLERFFRLEASGWKGRAATAILHDPHAHRLYTNFARAAAAQGWLRLHFLELDGAAIAADYTCFVGDTGFLVKTCFDERFARLSPGIVLRAAALQAAIESGLSRYEFLGGPDRYKLRWGAELHERLIVAAYRGTALPEFAYRHKLRPLAGRILRRRREPHPG